MAGEGSRVSSLVISRGRYLPLGYEISSRCSQGPQGPGEGDEHGHEETGHRLCLPVCAGSLRLGPKVIH